MVRLRFRGCIYGQFEGLNGRLGCSRGGFEGERLMLWIHMYG